MTRLDEILAVHCKMPYCSESGCKACANAKAEIIELIKEQVPDAMFCLTGKEDLGRIQYNACRAEMLKAMEKL